MIRDEIQFLGETVKLNKKAKLKYKKYTIKILNISNLILYLEYKYKEDTNVRKIPLNLEEYHYLLDCVRNLELIWK